MQLVLDANIYIFGFGLVKVPACEKLISIIIEEPSWHILRISRSIVKEIRHHLSPEDFQEFIGVVSLLTKIDEDFLIPFELGAKYEVNLKPADALIAAYTDWTGADALVTENRHFLSHQTDLPFKVLNAESCLKILRK